MRPWLTTDELADSLVALGKQVVVNAVDDGVLPMPPAWSRGIARQAARYVDWRRRARRSLKSAGVDRILVWDPLLVVVCRAARPRGVEIVWVPPDAGPRRRDRVVHSAARVCSDRVASAPPVMSRGDETIVDGWVVLAPQQQLGEAALDSLRERARATPAAAVVFDARMIEMTSPQDVARLVEATRVRAVWRCGDDEWITRLGGVPAVAVDPSPTLALDHRHLRVLAAGGSLLRLNEDGWADVSRRDLGPFLDSESQWAAAVFDGGTA